MLDNGFSLTHLELLNWGNFHGMQKINFRELSEFGPLFAPPPAAAILGINGSGKSTLIDGLMMALLPFENSLKLGVTNDAESGGSGGRTIRDYVLGKFSSTGEEVSTSDPQNVFGRKDGCSIFLLRFQHNRSPDRILTLGRIWWYQNYKVSDTQLAFLFYDTLTISDLCLEQQVPKSAKAFRDMMREHRPSVQLFETMQSYFMAVSNSLGGISKDDLKILNRAFYVKSISQIDHFIRENMLLEQSNPHLDRLLENVKSGQEIARSIETCNQKIELIRKILKGLLHLQTQQGKKEEVNRKRQLLILYSEWNDLKRSRLQLEDLEKASKELLIRLPDAEEEVRERQKDLAAVQALVAKNDLTFRIQQLDTEILAITEKVQMYSGIKKNFEAKFAQVKWQTKAKMPQSVEEWPTFQALVDKETLQFEGRGQELQVDIEKLRREKFTIESESTAIKSDLEHLGKVKGMIPRDLYDIKTQAMADLKIPEHHLFFVGELIQVKDEFQGSRLAIESVLFPISRNLLCHPGNLQVFTKWLDQRGFKSDVTVKRISPEELSGFPTSEFVDNSILKYIDVLPSTQNNPFYHYLWRWLEDTFDYRLVEVAEFKKSDGKLVTPQGLVKTDSRTMRKLKQNFSYSLGWDNAALIQQLTERMVCLNAEFQKITQRIAALRVQELAIEESRLLLGQLKTETNFEFLNLDKFYQNQILKSQEKERLLQENPSFHQLKSQAQMLEQAVAQRHRLLSDLESQIKSNHELSEKLRKIIPVQAANLEGSLFYNQLLRSHGSLSLLERALAELEKHLLQKKLTRVSFESELNSELLQIESQIHRCISQSTNELSQYKRVFSDNNLSYELQGMQEEGFIAKFCAEWSATDERLRQTELPDAEGRWRKFFDQILMDSVKDTINEIKAKLHDIQNSIESINEVLKLTNFEDLPTEQRYLSIHIQSSQDDRIRRFRRQMNEVERILGPQVRANVETRSEEIMKTLLPFVEDLQKDQNYRLFVTDVRNHFLFKVHSLRRLGGGQEDLIVETFTGSRKDAKSSAQTTQLAYALLASCLAYRFKFHDPSLGQDTPRLLILDEFGGKFDNEKPKDILRLLGKMGFQSILVSPMSKADLLADNINQLILVHKVSASHSKARSYSIQSRDDYDRLLAQARGETPEATP